jgi:hypothetical protein
MDLPRSLAFIARVPSYGYGACRWSKASPTCSTTTDAMISQHVDITAQRESWRPSETDLNSQSRFPCSRRTPSHVQHRVNDEGTLLAYQLTPIQRDTSFPVNIKAGWFPM